MLSLCFLPLPPDGPAISQDRNSRKATLMRAKSLSVTLTPVLPSVLVNFCCHLEMAQSHLGRRKSQRKYCPACGPPCLRRLSLLMIAVGPSPSLRWASPCMRWWATHTPESQPGTFLHSLCFSSKPDFPEWWTGSPKYKMKITPFLLGHAFRSEWFAAAAAKERRTPSTLLCDPGCGQRDSSKN